MGKMSQVNGSNWLPEQFEAHRARLRSVAYRMLSSLSEADAVGAALLVVLDRLTPAERLAFVLHDMFAVPFEEIAQIVGRSPHAARQLASRARRRVQGTDTVPDADVTRQREVVDAFLRASRDGDFEALLAILDPDVVLRADGAAVEMGASMLVRGRPRVVFDFTIISGKVVAIDMVADPESLGRLDLVLDG